MNIAELLKRKGIIKRSPEEIAKMASRASSKVQETSPLVATISFPPIPDNLKWLDVPPTIFGDVVAYAWIASHYLIRIKRNVSGRYRDKHLISIHTFYDKYDGKAIVNPEPIASRWHLCHFTNDRATLKEIFE